MTRYIVILYSHRSHYILFSTFATVETGHYPLLISSSMLEAFHSEPRYR